MEETVATLTDTINPKMEVEIINEEAHLKLRKVKEVANSYLALEDDNFIDFALAVVVANQFDADPLFGGIIAPPSSAKTEILRALAGYKRIHMLSNITPQTLLSGWKDKKKGNQSLLPKLNGKVIVIKEFTTILQKRSESRAEILSQFREMYDGSMTSSFGTGDTVNWKGKVGVLLAVTPVIDNHLSFMQALGERFVYYRIENENETDIAECALANALGESGNRDKMIKAVHDFLNCFDKDVIRPNIGIPKTMEERLVKLSILCAKARTSVQRESWNKEIITSIPTSELPARLVKQLKLLTISLSCIRGINIVDEGVYEIVKKVGSDSIPPLRLSIIKTVWEQTTIFKKEWLTTDEIKNILKMSKSTVKYQLDDLKLLGLTDRKGMESTTSPALWRPTQYLLSLIEKSKVFIT